MKLLRRLLRRDRIVLHKIGAGMYATTLKRGAQAGDRIVLKD